MPLRNPLIITRRARSAATGAVKSALHRKRLAHFTRQGIEPSLTWAGTSVLSWELCACGPEELPGDRREHLASIARQVYSSVVPDMRATYGPRSPGDLPDIEEVLEKYRTPATRQVPSSLLPDETGHHDQSIDIRERTRIAEMLLRHTLAEILIHPAHLEEDFS